MVERALGEVVEVQARAEVAGHRGGRSRTAEEAVELGGEVAAQELGIAGHGGVGAYISAYQLIWLSRIAGQR